MSSSDCGHKKEGENQKDLAHPRLSSAELSPLEAQSPQILDEAGRNKSGNTPVPLTKPAAFPKADPNASNDTNAKYPFEAPEECDIPSGDGWMKGLADGCESRIA